ESIGYPGVNRRPLIGVCSVRSGLLERDIRIKRIMALAFFELIAIVVGVSRLLIDVVCVLRVQIGEVIRILKLGVHIVGDKRRLILGDAPGVGLYGTSVRASQRLSGVGRFDGQAPVGRGNRGGVDVRKVIGT